MFFFDVFLLGFLTHAGLLLGTTLQATYLLSRGLAGMSTIPMATVFVLSSLIASGIAILGVNLVHDDNDTLHMVISVLGAIILLRESYKSYQRSKQDSLCCVDNKIYSVFLAISIMWLNPHIYTDIIAVSGIITTLQDSHYSSFYYGFNLVAVIWFFGVALFAKQAKVFFQDLTYHKYMHKFSALILIITATILIVGVFGFELFHHHD